MSKQQQKSGADPLPVGTPTPKKNLRQIITALVVILSLCCGGLFLSRQLLHNKPKAGRKRHQDMKTVVRVDRVQAKNVKIQIEALGTVLAADRLDLKPWVSGRVEFVHPSLTPGGRLEQGDIILQINREEYELALEKSRNGLEQSRMDMRLEEGNQAVAKKEFDLIKEYTKRPVKEASVDLALRKPQLAKAKAEEAAARTEVERASLALERTTLRVPFDAVVLEKAVAIGAQVSSQTTVAVLVGSATFHIRASVPRRDVDKVQLPVAGLPSPEVDIKTISATGEEIHHRGHILRLLSDVDPKGLMPRLLIEVNNPLEQHPEHPLLLGSVVKVTLPGKELSNCFLLPRSAVRADKTILLADANNRLEIRKVTSVHEDERFVYVAEGLRDGERIILSPVAAPVPGMALTMGDSSDAKGKGRRE